MIENHGCSGSEDPQGMTPIFSTSTTLFKFNLNTSESFTYPRKPLPLIQFYPCEHFPLLRKYVF